MFVADAHCDTLFAIALDNCLMENCMASCERLRLGGVGIQTFALFAGAHGPQGTPYLDGQKMLAAAKTLPIPFLTGDLPEHPPQAPTGVFSVEGGEILEGRMERLYALDQAARIRMIALTWNHPNEIGHPAKLGPEEGLTPFGFELLREMDALGIYADTSHLNERGFWDVYERMSLPPIASHSNARELCDVFRNLNRDQIRAIIEKKGFIGINFYPRFLVKEGDACIDDVLRHIDAIAEMGGIDALGFGSDFDGIESQPKGLENAACFPALCGALLAHGYTQAQVEGIAGLNLWKLLKRGEAARTKAV